MKNIITTFHILLLSFSSYSQILKYDIYPSVTPSDNDTVKIYLTLLTPGGYSKKSSVLELFSDSIRYFSCYDITNLTSLEPAYDTLILNPLSTGIYHYRLIVSKSYSPDTFCEAPNVTNAYDTLLIFSKYTGVSQASSSQLQAVLLGAGKLQLHSPQQGMASIQVLDATGRLCYAIQQELAQGKNDINLDIPAQPQGLYFYHVQIGEQRKVLKYVKQ